MESNQTTQKSNGALIGAIIIIFILIIGGIYLWKSSMKKLPIQENTNTTATNTTTNSTSSLDASVNSIDLDSLDKGI